MEESGKASARRERRRLLSARSILLAAFLCASISAPLEALDVDFFVSSYEAVVGDEVEVRITVYGVDPGSVTLEVADVPVGLTQSASRKERERLENPATPGEPRAVATVIAQKWIASVAGSYTLGPFVVTAKGETASIPPIHLSVAKPRASGETTLRWRLAPGEARVGDAMRIVLEASLYGTAGSVFCDAPENALLEAVPVPVASTVSTAGDGWTPVAAWNWTPLGAGLESLPVAVLEYETPEGQSRKVASPVISVSVAPGARNATERGIPRSLGRAFSKPAGKATSDEDPSRDAAPFRAPPEPPALSSYPDDPIFADSRALWAKGSCVEALAALRRAEHERFFPNKYRDARVACEIALALSEVLPVPPAAWKHLSVIGTALFLSLALTLRLAGFRFRFFARLSYLVFALMAFAAAFSVFVYVKDLKPVGVVNLSAPALLHVPESRSSVVENLRPGLPVRVLRSTGDWLFVETPSSLRGWLPSRGVTVYTATENR